MQEEGNSQAEEEECHHSPLKSEQAGIRGIGTDIIEISRLEKAIQRYGARFLDRLFTPKEQLYCYRYRDSSRHFAGRFAAKEAAVKALGTGINKNISWLDIEILNDAYGRPILSLSDKLKLQVGSLTLHVSISHCQAYATAFVIWQK